MDILLDFCGGVFGLVFCLVIIVLGICNIVFAYIIKSSAAETRSGLKGDYLDNLTTGKDLLDSVVDLYKRSEDGYIKINERFKLFVSLSEIFPLLGILGTLIGLIQYRGQIANLKASFAAAIVTTIFGIVFAVIFKVIEGFMLGDIDFIKERMVFYQDLHSKVQLQKKEKNL